MDKNRHKIAAMVLFFLWTAGILYGSLTPGDSLPRVGWLSKIPQFDKIVHFGFYLGQVALLILWLRPSRGNRLWIALAAIAFSGAIELLQGEYCDRSADWLDLAANSAGALTGIPLAALLGKIEKGVSSRKQSGGGNQKLNI